MSSAPAPLPTNLAIWHGQDFPQDMPLHPFLTIVFSLARDLKGFDNAVDFAQVYQYVIPRVHAVRRGILASADRKAALKSARLLPVFKAMSDMCPEGRPWRSGEEVWAAMHPLIQAVPIPSEAKYPEVLAYTSTSPFPGAIPRPGAGAPRLPSPPPATTREVNNPAPVSHQAATKLEVVVPVRPKPVPIVRPAPVVPSVQRDQHRGNGAQPLPGRSVGQSVSTGRAPQQPKSKEPAAAPPAPEDLDAGMEVDDEPVPLVLAMKEEYNRLQEARRLAGDAAPMDVDDNGGLAVTQPAKPKQAAKTGVDGKGGRPASKPKPKKPTKPQEGGDGEPTDEEDGSQPKKKKAYKSYAIDPSVPYMNRTPDPQWTITDIVKKNECVKCAAKHFRCMIVREPEIDPVGAACFYCFEARVKCSLVEKTEPPAGKKPKGKGKAKAEEDDNEPARTKKPPVDQAKPPRGNAEAGPSKSRTAIGEPTPRAGDKRRHDDTGGADVAAKRPRTTGPDPNFVTADDDLDDNQYDALEEQIEAVRMKARDRHQVYKKGINNCKTDIIQLQEDLDRQREEMVALKAKFDVIAKLATDALTGKAKVESRMDQVEAENRRLLDRAIRSEMEVLHQAQYIDRMLPGRQVSGPSQTLVPRPAVAYQRPDGHVAGSSTHLASGANHPQAPRPTNWGIGQGPSLARNQRTIPPSAPGVFDHPAHNPTTVGTPSARPPAPPVRAVTDIVDHDGDSTMSGLNHAAQLIADGTAGHVEASPVAQRRPVTLEPSSPIDMTMAAPDAHRHGAAATPGVVNGVQTKHTSENTAGLFNAQGVGEEMDDNPAHSHNNPPAGLIVQDAHNLGGLDPPSSQVTQDGQRDPHGEALDQRDTPPDDVMQDGQPLRPVDAPSGEIMQDGQALGNRNTPSVEALQDGQLPEQVDPLSGQDTLDGQRRPPSNEDTQNARAPTPPVSQSPMKDLLTTPDGDDIMAADGEPDIEGPGTMQASQGSESADVVPELPVARAGPRRGRAPSLAVTNEMPSPRRTRATSRPPR